MKAPTKLEMLEKMTVQELKAIATKNGFASKDIPKKKSDLVAKLVKSRKVTKTLISAHQRGGTKHSAKYILVENPSNNFSVAVLDEDVQKCKNKKHVMINNKCQCKDELNCAPWGKDEENCECITPN